MNQLVNKHFIGRFLVTVCLAIALVFALAVPALAADYNCGAYGAGAYDNGSICGATTTESGGGLSNTGQQVLAIAIPAGLIIIGTILLLRVRRKSKHTPAPPQQ